MDHTNSFRLRAVVDWIGIQIETIDSTNFQTVKRAFWKALHIKVHVSAINPNEGGGTRHFVVRLHDIEHYSDIEKMLREVRTHLALKPDFKIVIIEVALDAYSNDPAAQAAKFYKFMTSPVSDNRRMYRSKKDLPSFAVPSQLESMIRYLTEGWQIGIGNEADSKYQHIYVKNSDTRGGKRHKVEERARFEIRLSGDSLPCQSSEEWQQFKFEKLAHYFRMRKLKDDLHLHVKTWAMANDIIGERKTRNRRGGGTRQYSKSTKADPINEEIRQVLRNLSKRWASSGKRGRPAKKTCGNSVRINARNSHEQRKQVENSNNYIYKNTNTQNNKNQCIQDANVHKDNTLPELDKPIQIDPIRSGLSDLLQPFEIALEAKSEHDRARDPIETAISIAATHPDKIEVLEKSTTFEGSSFINGGKFSQSLIF